MAWYREGVKDEELVAELTPKGNGNFLIRPAESPGTFLMLMKYGAEVRKYPILCSADGLHLPQNGRFFETVGDFVEANKGPSGCGLPCPLVAQPPLDAKDLKKLGKQQKEVEKQRKVMQKEREKQQKKAEKEATLTKKSSEPGMSWSISNVCDFITSLQLKEYVQNFKKNKIDGPALMALNEDDLKDLGIGILGHRKKIMGAIYALQGRLRTKSMGANTFDDSMRPDGAGPVGFGGPGGPPPGFQGGPPPGFQGGPPPGFQGGPGGPPPGFQGGPPPGFGGPGGPPQGPPKPVPTEGLVARNIEGKVHIFDKETGEEVFDIPAHQKAYHERKRQREMAENVGKANVPAGASSEATVAAALAFAAQKLGTPSSQSLPTQGDSNVDDDDDGFEVATGSSPFSRPLGMPSPAAAAAPPPAVEPPAPLSPPKPTLNLDGRVPIQARIDPEARVQPWYLRCDGTEEAFNRLHGKRDGTFFACEHTGEYFRMDLCLMREGYPESLPLISAERGVHLEFSDQYFNSLTQLVEYYSENNDLGVQLILNPNQPEPPRPPRAAPAFQDDEPDEHEYTNTRKEVQEDVDEADDFAPPSVPPPRPAKPASSDFDDAPPPPLPSAPRPGLQAPRGGSFHDDTGAPPPLPSAPRPGLPSPTSISSFDAPPLPSGPRPGGVSTSPAPPLPTSARPSTGSFGSDSAPPLPSTPRPGFDAAPPLPSTPRPAFDAQGSRGALPLPPPSGRGAAPPLPPPDSSFGFDDDMNAPPLPVGKPVLATSSSRANEHLSCAWYLKDSPKDKAMEMIEFEPSGAFVIRDSNSEPGSFALSYVFNGKILNKLLDETASGFRMRGGDDFFPSLIQLVERYMTASEDLKCPLRAPRDPAIVEQTRQRKQAELSQSTLDDAALAARRAASWQKAAPAEIPAWNCLSMGRDAAMAKLTGKPQGTFVIRPSDKTFAALSMVSPTGLYHMHIEKEPSGDVCFRKCIPKFPDLNLLVEHYTRPSTDLPCPLKL